MKKAEKQKAVFSQSRSDLMELRRLIMEAKDTEVKNLSMKIC